MEEEPKTLLQDVKTNVNYVKGKLLGTGGFAKCFQAISQKDGRLYAAKVIPKKSINQKRQRYKLLAQIKLHRSLKHHHIVEFINAFEDKQNIYMLLEYCRNYTLKDLVKRRKRLTEYETRVYIGQVVKAIMYIHQQGVIHRDLKLGNILINDQMDVKICDFGLSTRIKFEGQIKKTICGTPNYIAPETIEEQGHSYEVDIWAIGVSMYTLLFGKPPFEDVTVDQTYQNIKTNRYIFPANIHISMSARDLINRILVLNPSRRISLSEILEHQFMTAGVNEPSMLPLSSLAVPPPEYEKYSTKINLQDEQIEQSISVLAEDQTHAFHQKKYQFNFIVIRECFRYENTIGYLLSSGIVGVYDKKKNTNVVYEFGEEHYYHVNSAGKKTKIATSGQSATDEDFRRLSHFKSYYVTKYSLFKLQEMRKRCKEDSFVSLSKGIILSDSQIVSRLTNDIIQMHFSDLTSLAINRLENKGLYYIDRKGKQCEVVYNECKDKKLKIKLRRFSNLMRLLSEGGDQDEGEEELDPQNPGYEEQDESYEIIEE